MDPLTQFDAALAAGDRQLLPTGMGTAELRDQMGVMVLARSVFAARATSAIFVSRLKVIIDQLAAGEIGEGQARTALAECLQALGYTPEGGFPDAPAGSVPPAVAGSLQDLRSFRRMDLIIRTQLDLMTGAGQQLRGMEPARLAEFPAWELVRVREVMVPRDWRTRWTVSGGRFAEGFRENAIAYLMEPTGMIAFKGDDVWGELGSYDNFQDALGVDHAPFCFNSGVGVVERDAAYCLKHGVTGPNGETVDEWLASQPRVMAGQMPLPAPKVSMDDVDPAIRAEFEKATHATPMPGRPTTMDYSDLLEAELRAGRDAYQAQERRNP